MSCVNLFDISFFFYNVITNRILNLEIEKINVLLYEDNLNKELLLL